MRHLPSGSTAGQESRTSDRAWSGGLRPHWLCHAERHAGGGAAGGARAPLPDSLAIPDFLKRKPAMPPVANVARAIDSGFLPNQRLYHRTDAPDFPAFAYGSSRARSLGLPQAGFWAAEDPKYLEDMARLVGRPDGTGSRVSPPVPRYSHPASVTLQPGFTHPS